MSQEGNPNEPNVSLDGILAPGTNSTANLPNNPAGNPPPASPASPEGTPPATPPPTNTPTTGGEPVTLPDTFEGLVPLLSSDTISDDLKETRDTLLSTFKATKVDKTGNLVDAEGKVVLSAVKLKDFIENDKIPTDANGNMINDKGEILKTNTQILDENSVVKPLVRTLETNFGVELSKDLVFEESEEGIINAVEAIVKTKTNNIVGSFLESNPMIKAFAEHIALGNNPDTFSNTHVDYKSVNVKTLDKSAKLALLDKAFTLQGTPSKDTIIKLIDEKGEEELNKTVAEQIKYLDNKQTEDNKHRSELLAERAKRDQEDTDKYWEDVNKLVSVGKIGNINIPLADREAFYNYMSKPIDEDFNSAEYLDAQKDSIEFNLLVSYLRYKKGDISRLAGLMAKQDKVDSFKERIAKYNNVSGNGSAPITHNANGNTAKDGIPSIEQLLG